MKIQLARLVFAAVLGAVLAAPVFAQTNVDTTTGIAGSSSEAARARADADARARAEANARNEKSRRDSEDAISRVRGLGGIGSSVSSEASGGFSSSAPANTVGSGSVGVGVGSSVGSSTNTSGASVGSSSGSGSPK
jgi:hypothetical protein